MKKVKIALFHPWIKSKGGAEKVVLELLEKSKHDFDVYTWVYDEENTFPEFKKYKINVLASKFWERVSRFHILRGLFLPLSVFSKIPLEKYDKFLISTSGVGEFITFRNYKKGQTYAYVCTPLREASEKIIKWNLQNRYQNNMQRKILYLISVKIYHILEKFAWRKLDRIAFISELSKNRAVERKLIKNKKVSIIFPPIDFSRFKNLKDTKEGDYFLYYSRLNSPKRQDILLQAWKSFVGKNPKYKLIIAGNIDNKKYFSRLKKLQAETKNVEIRTNVSGKDIEKLLSNSKAGIFLGYEEDFGIVPFEILASGKQLIAVNEGGYVKLIDKHPNFFKIKEMHDTENMINEVEKSLNKFVKIKRGRKKYKKIKLNNFIKDIDSFLGD